jgi:hypothetical protein
LTEIQTHGTHALCRSILVLKQLITDEFDSRAVEPELLYEFVSMVLCTPHAQLVDLTVDAIQPLVHLEHLAKRSLGAVLQPEQGGVGHAQQTPIQLDLAWPLALSICSVDLGDFTSGLLLVGKGLVSVFYCGHRSTLLPSRLVNLAS